MFDQHNLQRLFLLGLIITAVMHPAISLAQQAPASADTNAGIVELDRLTRRMEAHLRSLPALDVAVRQSWTLDGQSARQGSCQLSLQANHDGPFRLEIRAAQKPPVMITCVGDGRQITRAYDDGRHRLVSRRDGTFHELTADHLTASCLAGSGLDVLCQTRIHQRMMSQVSQVQYLGTASLPQGETHHFRYRWEGSSDVELWISASDTPLLTRQTRTVSLDDGKQQKLTMVSDYQWNRRDPWPPETFRIDTTGDFVKVADLYAYLLEGAARGMIGQAVPAITLRDTRDKEHELTQYTGKSVVCLFFWTTWATASTQQKAEVYRLMDDFAGDAVVFYAVNVGESKETVVEFVKQTGFKGIVLLDVDQELVHALRITSLPVCVLIGKDGKVSAVHLGNTEEDRELVRRDLAALCGREAPKSDN